jgi:very-short-patch-repair endonuclease
VAEAQVSEPGRTAEAILLALARAAYSLWPSWYVPWERAYGDEGNLLLPLFPGAAPDAIRGVDRFWLARASRAVGSSKVPYFDDLGPETQAQQLGLALNHAVEAIHVVITPKSFLVPGQWLRFDRRLEALSLLTGLPSVLLIDENISQWEEFAQGHYRFERLEAVSGQKAGGWLEPAGSDDGPGAAGTIGTVTEAGGSSQAGRVEAVVTAIEAGGLGGLGRSEQTLGAASTGKAYGTEGLKGKEAADRTGSLGACEPGVSGGQGVPNPQSPPEIELFQAMSSDSRFQGLFWFNYFLKTPEQSFEVDLYWPMGELVVEVDGYRYHNQKKNFQNDRHRDYLHLISGRSVLRLTAMEVMQDVGAALEKIWQVITFIAKRDGLTIPTSPQ